MDIDAKQKRKTRVCGENLGKKKGVHTQENHSPTLYFVYKDPKHKFKVSKFSIA